MFDLGWLEILIIAITALIVVGPKDLPNLFKKVGVFVGKAKAMGREFQRGMEDAADQSGLNEASAALNKMNNLKESPTNLKRKVVNEYFEKNKSPSKFSSKDNVATSKKVTAKQSDKKTKSNKVSKDKNNRINNKNSQKSTTNFKTKKTTQNNILNKKPKVVNKKNVESKQNKTPK